MEYYFDTKEKYIGFLEKLVSYCDLVAILREDDNVPSEVADQIMRCKSEAKWMKDFPGYGKSRIKEEVLFYPLNKKVISAFKEYDSFIKVGYNSKTELGFDMAFYKGTALVFNVLRHEDLCYLFEEHEPYFKDIIQKYKLASMWIS